MTSDAARPRTLARTLREWPHRHGHLVEATLALVAPPLVCLALVPVRASLPSSAAALALVACVSAVASLGWRVSGLLASASAALWFDFFLTRPYERLAISHRPDVETTIALVVVGIVVTELGAWRSRQKRATEDATHYVIALRDVAEASARATSAEVVGVATTAITDLLHLRECHFDEAIATPPLARVAPDGVIEHAGMLWPTERIGIPGPQSEIVAHWRGRDRGRFVLTPTPGEPVSRGACIVAASIVTVAAAALGSPAKTG